MTLSESETVVRRLLVTLDSSDDGWSGLDAAADVAVRLDAELTGLFVKDAGLVELAGLSCAREVRLTSAWGKRMRPTTMERQLRVKETAARRALAAAAARRQLEWSFRVTAHKPGAAMMASEPDVQLVLLPPREGRPRARFTLAGDTVVWGAEAMQGRSGVTVTYDGSAIAKRALVTAARLAREDGLNILIPADEQAPAHEREATDVLAALGVPAWFLPLAPGDIRAVAHAVRANRSTVLVLASDSALLGDDPIDRLIAEVGVPVLLVRPGRE